MSSWFWFLYSGNASTAPETYRNGTTEVESYFWSSTFSPAFHLILPVAGIALLWLRKDIFTRLWLQLDRNCVAVFCPSLSKRDKLLKWAGGRLPVTWSTQTKSTLSGGVAEMWTDGSLLCTLINSAVPGACPNPHRHWKKPPNHAQAIAYKYLGLVPLFSEDDFSGSFTSRLERIFLIYLSQLQKAISKLSDTRNNLRKISNQYIVRGMGLYTGEQHRKVVFFVYSNPHRNKQINSSNIIIHIRGPYGTFGKAVIPEFQDSQIPEIKLNEPTKTYGKFRTSIVQSISSEVKKIMKYHKKHTGDHIVIDVTMEDNRAKVAYIPKNYGMYEIHLISDGELLMGSPYNVNILKNTTDIIETFDNEHNTEIPRNLRRRKIISKTIDFIDQQMSLDTLAKLNREENGIKRSPSFKEVVDEVTRNALIVEEKERLQIAVVKREETLPIASTDIVLNTTKKRDKFGDKQDRISEESEDEYNYDCKAHIFKKANSKMDVFEKQTNETSEKSTNEAGKQINVKRDMQSKIQSIYARENFKDNLNDQILSKIKQIERKKSIPDLKNHNFITKASIELTEGRNRTTHILTLDDITCNKKNVSNIKNILQSSDDTQKRDIKLSLSKDSKENTMNTEISHGKHSEKPQSQRIVIARPNISNLNKSENTSNKLKIPEKFINESNMLEQLQPTTTTLQDEINQKTVKNITNELNFPEKLRTINNRSTEDPNSKFVGILEQAGVIDKSEKSMLSYNNNSKKFLVYSKSNNSEIYNRAPKYKEIFRPDLSLKLNIQAKSINTENSNFSIRSDTNESCTTTSNNGVQRSNERFVSKFGKNKSMCAEEKNASPICSDHIVTEEVREYRSLPVWERRKLFALHNPTISDAVSQNSSFSDDENVVASKESSGKTSTTRFVINLEETDTSISSYSNNFSLSSNGNDEYSLTSTLSLPNISSIDNDNRFRNLVKEKKDFWERVSSRSSSPVMDSSEIKYRKGLRTHFSGTGRDRIIWGKENIAKPQLFKNLHESKSEIRRSADDILSMADYGNSTKIYKSMDNSLDTCTVLSIEERKKLLLKHNYEKEKNDSEKFISRNNVPKRTPSLKPLAGSIESNKEIRECEIKDSAFSPVYAKIKQFDKGIVDNHLLKTRKPSTSSTKIQIHEKGSKSDILVTDANTYLPQKLTIKSHFKRAIKYFKNLEQKSATKLKPKEIFLDNFNRRRHSLELLSKQHKVSNRGGSLNLPKVSERFSISNLYDDVFGRRRGNFRGTPNRSAVVQALATFSRTQKHYRNDEEEDEIHYNIFKNIKKKQRKSLKSIFDVHY